MISKILRGKWPEQTVFTLADIARLTGRLPDINLIAGISYYVKKGEMLGLAKGLYSLDANYSPYELGNKLRKPSYVSFYTVLSQSGIVFQPYTSIFLACNRSETRQVGGNKIIYRKIKDDILLNPLSIIRKNGVEYASMERGLLDTIYIDKEQHFDNLRSINWNLVKKLNDEVYRSKMIGTFIKKYVDSK